MYNSTRHVVLLLHILSSDLIFKCIILNVNMCKQQHGFQLVFVLMLGFYKSWNAYRNWLHYKWVKVYYNTWRQIKHWLWYNIKFVIKWMIIHIFYQLLKQIRHWTPIDFENKLDKANVNTHSNCTIIY